MIARTSNTLRVREPLGGKFTWSSLTVSSLVGPFASMFQANHRCVPNPCPPPTRCRTFLLRGPAEAWNSLPWTKSLAWHNLQAPKKRLTTHSSHMDMLICRHIVFYLRARMADERDGTILTHLWCLSACKAIGLPHPDLQIKLLSLEKKYCVDL